MTNTDEEKMGVLRSELNSLDGAMKIIREEIKSLELEMAKKIYGVEKGTIVRNIKKGIEYQVVKIELWTHEGYKIDESAPKTNSGVPNVCGNGIWSVTGCCLDGNPRKKDGSFSEQIRSVGINSKNIGNEWEVVKS